MVDGKATFELDGRATGFLRAVGEAQQGLGTLRNSVGGISSAMGTLAGGMAALGPALGLGALVTGVTRALSSMDALGDMADRIGVNVEKLQELQHAASMSGAGAEQLEQGLRFLNRRLGESAAGEEAASKALASIGIAASTSEGRLRPMEDVLGDVADKIKAAESPAERTRIAIEAFGREGTTLIPMLLHGRAGLSEYAEAARKLGVVLDEQTVRAAAKANDEFDALSKVVSTNLMRAFLGLKEPLLTATNLLARFTAYAGAGISAITTYFSGDASVDAEELAARIADVTAEIARLQSTAASSAADAREFGFEVAVPVDPSADIARLTAQREQMQKMLRDKLAAETASSKTPGAAVAKAPVLAPGTAKEIEQLQRKVLALAIPDSVARSAVELRQEIDKLVGSLGQFPEKQAEVIALGQTLEALGDQAAAAAQKTAAAQAAAQQQTAMQAAEKDLGLTGTLAQGTAEIKTLETHLATLRKHFADAAKDTPARDLFPEIAKAADAVNVKIGSLEEQFREQPAVLAKIRESFAGIQFGGLERELDAVVRGATNATQGFATVIDEATGIATTWTPMLQTSVQQVDELWFALGALPGAMSAADGSMVKVIDRAWDLAAALSAARVQLSALNAAATPGGNQQPAGVGVAGGTRGPVGEGTVVSVGAP
jgi:hypothetical protein